MTKDISKILLTNQEINAICKRLGEQISLDYANVHLPLVIGLLKGCIYFYADLTKHITVPIQTDFMAVSSYHGIISTLGDIQIKKDLEYSVQNRDVLIIEDIVDTGNTLKTIIELLELRGAKSVEVATLLDKPEGRIVSFVPKYIGTTIPNEFVVGYGLDYNELYRNLPFIGVLKKEIYSGGDIL